MAFGSYITKMVETREEAWEEVDKIFPAGYEKLEEISEIFRFPIYRSLELNSNNIICDLTANGEIRVKMGEYGENMTRIFIKGKSAEWVPPNELKEFEEGIIT